MKNVILVVIALAALASAACYERKAEPRPDYDGSHSASEKAHRSLDKEAGGN